jgi:excisionase family DNA binding protein
LIDDAARALGVSRRTVYYRIREGRLLTIRTRCGSQRVLISSIQALCEEADGPPRGGDAETPGKAEGVRGPDADV